MTLVSPDGKDFSTVIVNDSAFCKTYRIMVDARLEAAGKPLGIWRTKAQRAGEGYGAQWRRKVGNADMRNGAYEIHVEPWSIVTVTTLNDVEPCEIPTVPEKARKVLDADPEHGVLYADAFDGTGVPRNVTEYIREHCPNATILYPVAGAMGRPPAIRPIRTARSRSFPTCGAATRCASRSMGRMRAMPG